MADILTDTLEGAIGSSLWFHYDLSNDVLYLRLADERQTKSHAEETPEGVLVLRRESDEAVIGLTLVNWWQRFERGVRPDSIRELEQRIEPWGRRMAA